MDASTEPSSFPVQLIYQGKTVEVNVTVETVVDDMIKLAQQHFLPSASTADDSTVQIQLKLLHKGKKLEAGNFDPLFTAPPLKVPKLMILATEVSNITALNSKRSDPTIRGFDQERGKPQLRIDNKANDDWGPELSKQNKEYKFCRFDVCTRQTFGHRPGDTTPHEFEARNLLLKLATDPGIVAIMKDRELLVGTLGEMDPIDDRLMQQKHQQGVCLLGYNTNGGTRIDLKLRTDDLKTFRPYPQLLSTLVHELSHNWVGSHNVLFFTNYGQMMIDYCATHIFGTVGVYISGRSTRQIAALPASIQPTMNDVLSYVMEDLRSAMMQHGLDASIIEPLVRQRCDELIKTRGYGSGNLLGGTVSSSISSHPREMALQAAERRQEEHRDLDVEDVKKKANNNSTPSARANNSKKS
jgi:WLM domain